MGYEFIEESRVGLTAYDVSIKDIEERKTKALVFKSMKLATQRLNVHLNSLKRAADNRSRIYSPSYEKEFAIRYTKPKS
jgi:hypothetical protein